MTQENELAVLNICLKRRPADPGAPEPICPDWWGRAVQANFLNAVAQKNPALAERLHSDNEQHPYTVSPLFGVDWKTLPAAGQPLYIRVTSFSAELSALLRQGLFTPGQVLTLEWIPFTVEASETATLQTESYSNLIQTGIRSVEDTHFSFRFLSPVIFNHKGRTEPLPLPRLVFQSLLRKWNAYAPMTFPEDLVRFAEECLAISAFRIRSEHVPIKNGGSRVGAVGEIRYTALNRDKYWLSLLHTLNAFAPYCSTGAATGWGFGQTRTGAATIESSKHS